MNFWERLDKLIATHELVIDRPKGSSHPRFPGLVYPLDYGYLKGTCGGDGNGIDVWRGSQSAAQLVGVACTVDSLKGDAEIKLLIACTDREIESVNRFYSGNEFMSGIVIMRESETKAIG